MKPIRTAATGLVTGFFLLIANLSHAQCVHGEQDMGLGVDQGPGLGIWFLGGMGLLFVAGAMTMVVLWLAGGKHEEPALSAVLENEEIASLRQETREALRDIETEYERSVVNRIHGTASRRTQSHVDVSTRQTVTC